MWRGTSTNWPPRALSRPPPGARKQAKSGGTRPSTRTPMNVSGTWPGRHHGLVRAPARRRSAWSLVWPNRCTARLGAFAKSHAPEPLRLPSRKHAYSGWCPASSTASRASAPGCSLRHGLPVASRACSGTSVGSIPEGASHTRPACRHSSIVCACECALRALGGQSGTRVGAARPRNLPGRTAGRAEKIFAFLSLFPAWPHIELLLTHPRFTRV